MIDEELLFINVYSIFKFLQYYQIRIIGKYWKIENYILVELEVRRII